MIGRINDHSLAIHTEQLKKQLELRAKIIDAANDITYGSNDYSCILPPNCI